MAEIDQALNEIKRDGTYKNILAKWEPNEIVFQTRRQYSQEKFFEAALMCASLLAICLSVFMSHEIRKRKKAEKILKASESEFRLLFAANPNPMFIFDEQTHRFLAVNDAAVIKYRYSHAEFLALTVLDIRPPEDRAVAVDTISRHQGARESFIGIIRHRRKDGTVMLMEITASSVTFAGRPSRLCLMKDIGDRELAYEALRQSESRYRILHETMRDGFVRVSMEGKIIEFNRIFQEMLGYSPDELRTLTYQEITPERWYEFESRLVREQIIPRGYSDIYEKEYRRKDGAIFPAELRTILSSDDAGRLIGMWATVRDVTERKNAEAALRSSEELNRRTLQALPAHIAVLDREGRVIATNQAWEEFAAQNEAGGNPSVAVGASYLEVCRHAAAGNDGSAAEALAGIEAVMTGRQAQFTMEYPCHGPQEQRWFYMTVVPLGTPGESGVVVTHLNITARKQAEEEFRQLNLSLEQRVAERTFELARTVEALEGEIEQRVRAEEELKQANEQMAQRADQLRRLAGELTAVEQAERKRLSRILHDGLQQHLASVKIQIGGLTEQIENEDVKQAMEEIEQILGEAMTMSRSLSAELSPPILYEGGLSKGLEWLIRWMREKHRFSVDLSLEAVPELSEDVKMLVFESVRELLFNALKHAKSSRARVRLESVGEGELRVTVSDEGAGFDPTRLLPAGDGGGFGLFSIRERIGLIGGRLEIDSAPGRGSRMALTVPYCQADAAPFTENGACAPDILPPIGAGKDQETTIRVLLVDDHELFRKGIARLLKNEPGLEIAAEAKDGQQAIEFAQEHKPNVILMDIGLPGINGIEATRVIHERHPEVCIIGLSMYNDPEKTRDMLAAGATDYRTKGCTRAELVAAIREGLQLRKPTPK